MASRDKKVRRDQKKRDRAKRALAKEKRRQLRSAVDQPNQDVQFIDPAHTDVFGGDAEDARDTAALPTPATDASNPEIEHWWDLYMKVDGPGRLSMVREKLNVVLDELWRESLFPDAVFEAESDSDPGDYVALLETLAAGHRQLYDRGLLWFLRSRIVHYLSIGAQDKIEIAVMQDASAMTETNEAFYGIVSMLRLAGQVVPADALAEAGFRVMNASELMPWAVDELFHYFMDSYVRQCVLDGGDAKAIASLETVLEANDANMDAEVARRRAEMIRRLTGATKTNWVRNQLVGTDKKSNENRYLLSFEFSRWMTTQRGIAPIAADELRGLVIETLTRDKLTMRSYLDGIPQPALDEHLASLLGFMALDRFKAPATLIAAEHFVSFLSDAGLVNSQSMSRSLESIKSLDSQLRKILNPEWSSFTFLDPLRPSTNQ